MTTFSLKNKVIESVKQSSEVVELRFKSGEVIRFTADHTLLNVHLITFTPKIEEVDLET